MNIRTWHRGLAVLLVAGALLQFYLAGVAVFGLGPGFEPHVTSGHLFGFVALLLPIVAVAGRLGRGTIGASLTALVLYGLQYAFIESATPGLAALHPLNGALLLLVAVRLALGLPRTARA